MLITFLDRTNATVRAKCEGVSEEDSLTPLPDSPLMTVSGLVSHLRSLEYSLFEVMLLGHGDRGLWTGDDPDRETRIGVEVPIERLLNDYQAQFAQYRELVATLDLTPRRSGPSALESP